METKENYLKALTGKDENKAEAAALYLVDNSDVELFRMLVEKSDYLLISLEIMYVNVLKKLYQKIIL